MDKSATKAPTRGMTFRRLQPGGALGIDRFPAWMCCDGGSCAPCGTFPAVFRMLHFGSESSTAPMLQGWLGVPLFFVISGFRIHMRWAKQKARTHVDSLDFFKILEAAVAPALPAVLACPMFCTSGIVSV